MIISESVAEIPELYNEFEKEITSIKAMLVAFRNIDEDKNMKAEFFGNMRRQYIHLTQEQDDKGQRQDMVHLGYLSTHCAPVSNNSIKICRVPHIPWQIIK